MFMLKAAVLRFGAPLLFMGFASVSFARGPLSREPVRAFVLPGVWRSSSPLVKDFPTYRRMHIKNIVSLQGKDYEDAHPLGKLLVAAWQPTETPRARARVREMARDNGIAYVSFPVNSLKPGELDVVALEKAADFVMDPANQPVVFSCAWGVDRSGGLQFMIRIKYDHWSFERAYGEWQANGHYGARLRWTGRLDALLHEWARAYAPVPTCADFLEMQKQPVLQSVLEE